MDLFQNRINGLRIKNSVSNIYKRLDMKLQKKKIGKNELLYYEGERWSIQTTYPYEQDL
jgi:hypothetical protein